MATSLCGEGINSNVQTRTNLKRQYSSKYKPAGSTGKAGSDAAIYTILCSGITL